MGTGFLSVLFTKNKIIRKGDLADQAFEQICFLYNKRLALATQALPVQPTSSLSDKNNKIPVSIYVKKNMHFQKKLDSIILARLITKGSNEQILNKLRNNAEEIQRLKKNYHRYAKDYNTYIKQFPRNYYANIMDLPLKVYYELD